MKARNLIHLILLAQNKFSVVRKGIRNELLRISKKELAIINEELIKSKMRLNLQPTEALTMKLNEEIRGR